MTENKEGTASFLLLQPQVILNDGRCGGFARMEETVIPGGGFAQGNSRTKNPLLRMHPDILFPPDTPIAGSGTAK